MRQKTIYGQFLVGLMLILYGLFWLGKGRDTAVSAHHVNTNNYWNAPGALPANVEHHEFQSSYLNPGNNTVGLNVYTPPGYETPGNTTHYPVIYLLHGLSGNERNFFGWYNDFAALYSEISPFSLIEGTVPATLDMPEAIIVLVNGGTQSFYNDFLTDDPFHGPGSPFPILSESIIMNEVIPYVDANFRTIASRNGRAIEGFSMGGRGALKFAFKHADQFCSVIAYAGAAYESVPVVGSPYYGPHPLEDRISYIVDTNAANILANQLHIRLVVGSNDADRGNSDLSVQLTSYGISHEYVPDLPGVGHNWHDYYVTAGEYGLNFHEQCFQATSPPPSPTPTATPSRTPTNSPTPTITPSRTPTIIVTATPSRTPTNSPTPSRTPTGSPAPSVTPSRTPTSSPMPSHTPISSPTPTATPPQTPTPIDVTTPSVTPATTAVSSPTATSAPVVQRPYLYFLPIFLTNNPMSTN